MNLKQIVADGAYTVFARMGEETKIKQIEAVQYIKQLASTMEVNIDDWDIPATFGMRGNSLYTSRPEINKRFLERMQKVEVAAVQAATPTVDPILAAVQAQANTLIRSSILERIRTIEQQKNTALRRASDHARQMNESIATAFNAESSLRGMRRNEVDFAGQITAINAGGFWRFLNFTNNELVFVSTNDLLLRHRNVRSSIDVRVNLGKYKATVNVQTGRVQVFGHENNTGVGGNNREGVLHPHVSNGNICWGAAHEVAHRHITSYAFVPLMQLLANLLSDYNDENPYELLYSFKAEQLMQVAIKMANEGQGDDIIRKFFEDNQMEPDDITYFFDERAPGDRGDF
jgi:hypothetical protein